MMVDDLGSLITRLLEFADPDGANYKRLLRYQDLVARNVWLSGADRAYLRRLAALIDNVECQQLNGETGWCKLLRTPCQYLDDFGACTSYLRARPEPRRT